MLALSLAMVLTMSAPVFADGETTETTSATPVEVSNNGDIQNAINGADSSVSIKLKANIVEDVNIPSGKTVTIDLNGFTLTNVSNQTTKKHTITNYGTLTLTGKGTVDNITDGEAALYNEGTATIDGPTLIRSQENGEIILNGDATKKDDDNGVTANSYYTVENRGTLNINEGSVENKGSCSSCISNAANATINMTGGTVKGGLIAINNNKKGGIINISGGTVTDAALFAIANGGTATITGGTLNAGKIVSNYAATQSGVLENFDNGTMKITGGTFNANSSDGIINFIKHSNFSTPNDDVTITGGKFNGTLIAENLKNQNITIKPIGGTFTEKPAVPSGYVAHKNTNGTYTVYAANYENSWTTKLTIKSEWAYGDTTNKPNAVAKYGTVTYKYYDSNKKEIGSTQPTAVGSYYVKAFVAAGTNYCDLESDYVPFKINKAENKLTKDLTINSWTYGQTPSTPSATADKGTVEYRYYDKNGNLLTEAPTLPGTYYVTAYVKGNKDTADFESTKVEFKIYRPALNAKAKRNSRTSEKISWTKVKGADGYVVYYGRCGRSMKKIASTKTARTTVRRHLAKGKTYKYQVKAYKLVGGKKVVIARSYTIHAIANGYNSRYTDAKSVRVANSNIKIKVDESKKIRPSMTKYKSGRKLLEQGHAALYRYRSSDRTVAVVTYSGKIKAIKEGTCKVYVCAPDGVWKTVKVTVEK